MHSVCYSNIHTHTHIYTRTCTHAHTHTHTHTDAQTHTHRHRRTNTHTHRCHTRTHTHTHVGFYGLRGLSIGVMVFILYKLYVLLPYTYPTPKLSPHRRRCISIFPQKKLTLYIWFISILNYGDTDNVLINHLLLVIPMLYPCHYTNLCPHKPHKHAHTTHTQIYMHTRAHTDAHTHTDAHRRTHTQMHTCTQRHTHTHTYSGLLSTTLACARHRQHAAEYVFQIQSL